MLDVHCVVDCGNELGECPLWCSAEQVLWWVDIAKPSLWRLNARSGAVDHWPLPKPMGSFALCRDDSFFFVFRSGPASLAKPGAEVRWIEAPGLALGDERFNDGKCDRAGRFWSGTLDRRMANPVGALYRFESPEQCIAMDRGFILSNGIGWSPDGRIMYFTDTGTRRIYAYDYDLATGAISNRRIFVEVPAAPGGPDGLTVDAQGFIWSAQFGRWSINRYAPDGKLDRCVQLPVQQPTSVMFGGADLETIYVTSAMVGLTSEQRARQPHAGGVFAVDAGVKGLPEPRFGYQEDSCGFAT